MPSALVHSPPPGLSLRVLSALLLPAAWSEPTPMTFLDGYATYYAPGLMEKVAANRGIDLQAYLGGVALNRAGDLGRAVWLEWGPGQVEGPFLAVDCAQFKHFPERQRLSYVVEVDAGTARRHRFYGAGPVPVRVLFTEPTALAGPPNVRP